MRAFFVSAVMTLSTGCACLNGASEAEPSPITASSPGTPEPEPESEPQDPLMGFRHGEAPVHPEVVNALMPMEASVPVSVELDAYSKTQGPIEVDGAKVSVGSHDEGWDIYEVIDHVGERFLIESIWSGGGSGIFASTWVVELQPETLVPVFHVPGGDRCNGGFAEHPRFEGEALVVSRWISPADLVAYSSSDLARALEPYSDLESGAMSCIGFVTHRARPGTEEEELLSVTFAPGIDGRWHEGQDGWTENYRHQAVFNDVYARWVAAGDTSLDLEAIERFVDEFLAAR